MGTSQDIVPAKALERREQNKTEKILYGKNNMYKFIFA